MGDDGAQGASGGRLGKTTGFRRPSQTCFAATLILEILHRRPARVKAAFARPGRKAHPAGAANVDALTVIKLLRNLSIASI